MPGKMAASSGWRRRAMRLSRSSSFTRRVRRRSSEKVLRRNSPSVRGRGMREPPGELRRLYAEERGLGFGLRLSGFRRIAEARSPTAEARYLVDVAVAAGFGAGGGGTAEVGNDGFEIT